MHKYFQPSLPSHMDVLFLHPNSLNPPPTPFPTLPTHPSAYKEASPTTNISRSNMFPNIYDTLRKIF